MSKDPEYVFGWEARGIYESLRNRVPVTDQLIHTENVAQCCRMGRELGYRTDFTDVPGNPRYRLVTFLPLES